MFVPHEDEPKDKLGTNGEVFTGFPVPPNTHIHTYTTEFRAGEQMPSTDEENHVIRMLSISIEGLCECYLNKETRTNTLPNGYSERKPVSIKT